VNWQIPILLTLLCVYYEYNKEFPTNRAEIYDKAIKALLQNWDEDTHIERDEIYKDLSNENKIKLFAQIAKDDFAEKSKIRFFCRR
jgi:predicted NACHT family NTPase